MASLSYLLAIMLCSMIIIFCSVVESIYPENDKIIALPGQPPVNFSQYSGYITVDDTKNTSLFYYFVEAETDPCSKPLFIWLSGGPGGCNVCNTFDGIGAFLHRRGCLVRNEYSMNKAANMLYVDSPAGVGFSYFPNKSLSSSLNDDAVARDDLIFLQRWLEKFDVFKNRDIYIGGESYAGHYVPNLAKLILETDLKSNLRGLMLVSPALEWDSDYSFEYRVSYLWNHGIISDSTYDYLKNSPCDMVRYRKESYCEPRLPFMSPECQEVHQRFIKENTIYDSPFIYDVSGDLCPVSINSYEDRLQVDPKVVHLCERFIAGYYLQRSDVKEAFHAKFHRDGVSSDVLFNYSPESIFKSVIPTLDVIVRSGVHVLVASGDQDGEISFLSTKSLLGKLAKNLGLETVIPYMPWYKDLDQGQIGGWIQSYGQGNITHLSVKGGEHFLLTRNARELLMLFEALQNNKFPVKL